MDMFGGLTKTSSRIAIAAALGMTLGGFVMSSHPAKAADLGGDCCADLEERVAELEATTVRKGNKKVSVTLSGWVVKDVTWWDDGHENNVYVGDKDTTLSSHFQISGSATIAPGWSGGYTLSIEAPGNANGFFTNQQNDNTNFEGVVDGTRSDRLLRVLLSYMYVKSDTWGTINWGLLSQATDNVALLPDLSGTIIESNGVFFEGPGYFLRPKGADHSAKGQANTVWGEFVTCLSGGGIIGVDCNGNTTNGVRYDSPTWAGFSVSGGFGEDDYKDVAVKYAADWNNFKVSAAIGYAEGGRLSRTMPGWQVICWALVLAAPVVAIAGRRPALAPSPDEVAAIVEAPLIAFVPPAPIEIVERDVGEWRIRYGGYRIGELHVWGATARILGQLGAYLG
jgi:hypothetical protein